MCSPQTSAKIASGGDSGSGSGSDSAYHDQLQRATRLGALSLGFLLLATTLTIPYLQSRRDELGCDAVCHGSMTSARSTLHLLGAALVGRFSDLGAGRGGTNNNGATAAAAAVAGNERRRFCLLVGVAAAGVALVIANRAKTLTELWWSLWPSMLQQNMSVMKALFSDYHTMYDHDDDDDAHRSSGGSTKSSSKIDRVSSAGMLGMVAGLAFMVGPMMGSMVLSTYDEATALSLVLLVLSAITTLFLPSTVAATEKSNDKAEKDKVSSSNTTGFLHFLDVPSVRSPAAIFVLTNRLLMALSDHVFTVILSSSLKERFQFGPKEYGMFFSMLGLFYALAQGFAAKLILGIFGGNTSQGRSMLLVVSAIVIAVARYLAFHTASLTLVYILYAVLVTAIGISATIVNADATSIPAANEVGSFFGIMATVESGAGVLGPLLASTLVSVLDLTTAPLYAAVSLNVASALLTVHAYDKCLYQHIHHEPEMQDVKHAKQE